jgi:glutamine synthetase
VTDRLTLLPDSLETAIKLAENSDFVKDIIGEELLEKYLDIKKTEAADFAAAKDKEEFYTERYFSVI